MTTRSVDEINKLSERIQLTENRLRLLHQQNVHFRNLTHVLRAIETAIGDAIAGDAPNSAEWGLLTATEFLQVIHDVTTWSLTNFEIFKLKFLTDVIRIVMPLNELAHFTLSREWLHGDGLQ